MPGMICSFHTGDWAVGTRLGDGSYQYTCERTAGHPQPGTWTWLQTPPPPVVPGIGGLGEELGLDAELPAALASLGLGWFEYGLVERAYAERRPDDFARMVDRWSHTARGDLQYSVSSYLARALGTLSARGAVAYHPGRGTGRWSYNSDISWWSSVPAGDWTQRTAWVDVLSDAGQQPGAPGDACQLYVH